MDCALNLPERFEMHYSSQMLKIKPASLHGDISKIHLEHGMIWYASPRIEHCLIDPILLTGWVNGNLYERTNEVAGVLPIPADMRGKCGMAQFEPSLHSKQRHRYLAALQGTRKPVLPVHSTTEKELFRDLMAKNPAASFSTPSNIDNFVRLWNSHAGQDKDISYKVRIPLISVMSLTKLSVVRAVEGLFQW
jgi:hypothetical protein